MCWKQEWASTVNNLNWAILHTERAKAKLEGRIAGFEHYTLGRSEVEKARQGVAECEVLIAAFKESQERLKKLIDEVGISRTDNPARTRTLMNGRRRPDRP
jgi:hypothetical protein